MEESWSKNSLKITQRAEDIFIFVTHSAFDTFFLYKCNK